MMRILQVVGQVELASSLVEQVGRTIERLFNLRVDVLKASCVGLGLEQHMSGAETFLHDSSAEYNGHGVFEAPSLESYEPSCGSGRESNTERCHQQFFKFRTKRATR